MLLPVLTSLIFAGGIREESREVSGFSEVQLNGSGNVMVIQGNSEKVVVEADSEIIEKVTTEVKGKTLHLGMKSHFGWNSKPFQPVKYTVYIKNVERLAIYGSGDMTSSEIEGKFIDLSISGSGDINVENLEANELSVSISGSGECTTSGAVNSQDVQISGSGDYYSKQLDSNYSNVRVSGSGDVVVNVKKELDAIVSGSGDVIYYGSPSVSERTSGSGDVRGKGTASH